MTQATRRALLVTALFTIAGCGGTAGQNSLAPSGMSSSVANRYNVPAGAFLPVTHRAAARHATGGRYSTKKSLLFETDYSDDTVNIFLTSQLSQGDPPIATIDEPSGGCPYDMALAKNGTLYLADSCLSQVEVYPKGSTTMSGTITDGIAYPLGVAIDKSGTLYVSVYDDGGEIQEYANGSTSPTKTITGMTEPFGISLDKSGNLYIPDFGCPCVWELPAGGSSVTNLGLQDLTEPLQSAVDQKTGYLWVTDGGGDRVQVYKLGSTSPAQTIGGQGFPYSVTVQNKGKPLGEAVYGDEGNDDEYVFKPNTYTPYATITDGGEPTGSLLAKP
jgi:DNA-binding beta-propeller fold protein YncE